MNSSRSGAIMISKNFILGYHCSQNSIAKTNRVGSVIFLPNKVNRNAHPTLYMANAYLSKGNKYVFYVIPEHGNGMVSYRHPLYKTCRYYISNSMPTDDLAMKSVQFFLRHYSREGLNAYGHVYGIHAGHCWALGHQQTNRWQQTVHVISLRVGP